MSRLDTLYQHALDISLKHKSTVDYGVVPTDIYDELTKVDNGIPNYTYVLVMEDFIYEGELEIICHDLIL